MRTLYVFLATMLVIAGCSSTPEPEIAPEAVRESGTWVEYEVFGMDCPGCHGGLEKLAMSIPGVTSAEASWEDQKLRLIIAEDAEVTDEQIKSAISRANFTAGERLK